MSSNAFHWLLVGYIILCISLAIVGWCMLTTTLPLAIVVCGMFIKDLIGYCGLSFFNRDFIGIVVWGMFIKDLIGYCGLKFFAKDFIGYRGVGYVHQGFHWLSWCRYVHLMYFIGYCGLGYVNRGSHWPEWCGVCSSNAFHWLLWVGVC